MTSTTNREGRGEIEAAKHLLALSKKVATFASEAALAARRELRAARTEEGEAESFLKRAKERWEVVEIDAEDDEAPSKAASRGGGRGSGEIEAAKQRASLAKDWASSAAEALASAVSRLRNAKKERKAAEEFLKAVEKRAGVVELDLEDEHADEDELDGGSSAQAKWQDGARKRPRPAPLRWAPSQHASLPPPSNNSVVVTRGLAELQRGNRGDGASARLDGHQRATAVLRDIHATAVLRDIGPNNATAARRRDPKTPKASNLSSRARPAANARLAADARVCSQPAPGGGFQQYAANGCALSALAKNGNGNMGAVPAANNMQRLTPPPLLQRVSLPPQLMQQQQLPCPQNQGATGFLPPQPQNPQNQGMKVVQQPPQLANAFSAFSPWLPWNW